MSMRVLLTGSTGQLGCAIRDDLRSAGCDLITPSRADLDLADGARLRGAVSRAAPDAIVNCAAFTNVDGAEDDPQGALEANAIAVRTLAAEAAARDAILIHFSTDFVFDGEKAEPYDESDPPNPRSTYAMSKLVGEWLAATSPRHYVLRVESLFGGPAVLTSARRSSLDRIIDAIAEGRAARVFHDRTVSPSYVVDVAAATRQILERAPAYGVYHCVNSGSGTWLDIARECQRLIGAGTLVPIGVRDVSLRAARPVHAALSNQKLAAAGIVMPTWQDALARHAQRLRAHHRGAETQRK